MCGARSNVFDSDALKIDFLGAFGILECSTPQAPSSPFAPSIYEAVGVQGHRIVGTASNQNDFGDRLNDLGDFKTALLVFLVEVVVFVFVVIILVFLLLEVNDLPA